MTTASLFNISHTPGLRSHSHVTLAEFLRSLMNGEETSGLLTELNVPVGSENFEKMALCGRNPQWIQLQQILIHYLTGKRADKATLYSYRDAFEVLRKTIGMSESFRSSVLFAYLACGFRLKREGWGEEDKNSLSDFIEFCSQLLNPKMRALRGSSFLCPHRNGIEDELVERISEDGLARIVSIINGILFNLDHDKTLDLTIFHTRGTRETLLAVFPNIIFSYARRGQLQELLSLLDVHYQSMQRAAANLSNSRLKISTTPTDQHILKSRELCAAIAGPNWRKLERSARLELTPTYTELLEIAEHSTLIEVARYMPEYSAIGRHISELLAEQSRDTELLEWYKTEESLTPLAKALYETCFCYVWGHFTKANQGIALGMDRDHTDYQVRAFHLGYHGNFEFGTRAPLLYFRRSPRESGRPDIHSISLRQFWGFADLAA